ncbi:MAG: peptidyl-prolyl cis-trans isomerase [Elusimicrobia bacterium]|nr:peptidyl-prolyl cis-trans isomerase [Elusimicrobiota bacterium]
MKKALLSFLTIAIISTFSSIALAQDNTVAAIVNGEKILKNEVSKRMWLNHFERTTNSMIDEVLLIQEAKKLNLKVSKKEIDKRLTEIETSFENKEDFEMMMKNRKEDLLKKIEYELLIRKTIIKAKNISYTKEDLKKTFAENKAKFDRPETIKLRQIFVNSEKEANDAYLGLEAGADFAKLSSLKSTNENLKKNGGDLGYVSKTVLVKEISNAIAEVKIGQYTKPLKVGEGYTILKVEDIKKATPANFNKIKAELKETLINQAVMQNLTPFVSELRGQAKIEMLK